MSQLGKNLEELLDRRGRAALEDCTDEFRMLLLSEAQRTAKGERISEEDLQQALKRLNYPDKDSFKFADAQAVITQSLRENRVIEWVSYLMAVVLFGFGLFLLTIGALEKDQSIRVGCLVGGSIVEFLILIPFRFAINSRRQNIALRMLGLIINRVDDPKKLAPLLKDTFLAVVIGHTPFGATNE